ncbi:hypothetical protein PtA15_5A311 [Puccinia triticina]|uniref:Integrase catalytic domain-containing protein n=1 Tax=Puccinia triticina TaxID=208348 RepID=A0ABY7CIJ6_9BASI|nr:uncharacterized protein PtA15_5A311 [Puccinia triticina]WAQ84738.1 hypothetical protein PtA15_5A311 [Puccinia triticina]
MSDLPNPTPPSNNSPIDSQNHIQPPSPSIQAQTGLLTSSHIRNQQIQGLDALTIPFLALPTSSPHHPDNKKPIANKPTRQPTPPIPHYHFTPTPFNSSAPPQSSSSSTNPTPTVTPSHPPVSTPAATTATDNTVSPTPITTKKDINHETPPHMIQTQPVPATNPSMPDFANSPAGYYPPFPYMSYPYPYHHLPYGFPQNQSPVTPSPNPVQHPAFPVLYNADFFDKPTTNIHHEKIGRAILLHSIDSSLEDGISSISTCHEGFKNIKSRFNSVCRAAQISTLDALLKIDPDSFATSAACGARMNDLITDLKDLNIAFTVDNILGLLFQRNQQSGPVKQEMAQRVEHIMYTDALHTAPTFEKLLKMYNVCRNQVALSDSGGNNSLFPDIQSPHHMIADAPAEILEPEATVNNDDVAVNAARPNNNCHICRQPGHWSNSCPARTKPVPQKSGNTSNFRSAPQYSSPSYLPYCPIVVAPNFTPYGQHIFPGNPGYQPVFAPHNNSIPPNPPHSCINNQSYDSYKPNYATQKPAVSAKNIDVGNIEDEIAELQMTGEATAEAIGLGSNVITDTGATNHLTGDRFALFNFKLLQKPIPLRVATDSCNECITGVGTMVFPGKSGMTISVNGVMFCEQANATLISPSALRHANVSISYDTSSDTFLFRSSDDRILLESKLDPTGRCWTLPRPISRTPSDGSRLIQPPISKSVSIPNVMPSSYDHLAATPVPSNVDDKTSEFIFSYPIDKQSFNWHESDLTKDEMKLLFWHRVFGHAGLRRIQKMIKLNLGVGLPTNLPKGDIKCPVCMIAKGTWTNTLLPTFRPVGTLDIIACDLMGPFEIPTFGDGKYILAIRDIATSYSEIKIMSKKSEATQLLIDQVLRFETATGKRVRCIQSDNGGEFETKILADFIKKKGIKAERSLPYHHYQNGAIERYNRTVSDMGRAVLTDSHLPRSFWGFAFLWANYTLNRVPNKVSGNQTPFQAFYGYKPTLDHMRVFGCRAFVLTPPEKRKRLDDRAL